MLAVQRASDTLSSDGISKDPGPKGVRHPKLYFADGDIVLSSDSPDRVTTFYRVDRLYLSRQSVVFEEILCVPTSLPPEETYDGVAWVRMPDTTEELDKLLSAIYDASTLDLKRRDPNSCIELYGVMKLAKKYEIHSIRNLIIRHLEGDWPQNVEDWDNLQEDMQKALGQHIRNAPRYLYADRYIDDRFPEAASAVRFALDHKCPTLIRAATMVLVSASPTSDWTATRRNKFDMQYEPLVSQRTVRFPAVRWDLLGPNGKAALERGRAAFDKVLSQMADPKQTVPAVSGPHSCRQCIQTLDVWRNKHMSHVSGRDMQTHDPLAVLKRFLLSGRPNGVCTPCWERAEKVIKEMRVALWEEIPTTFGWLEQMSS